MTFTTDDTLVMVAELRIRPGQIDAFLAYTMPNLAVSRAYPGNRAFDILLDAERPDAVLFHEEWDSVEAQGRYMAWRTEQGDLTTLMGFLAEQPRFTAYRRVVA